MRNNFQQEYRRVYEVREGQLSLRDQIISRAQYSYPDKKQRAIDEAITGFNIPIIRFIPPAGVDLHFVGQKLTKIIYKHCVSGQEIMVYPAIESGTVSSQCNFFIKPFTGNDKQKYSSVVVCEPPRYASVSYVEERADGTTEITKSKDLICQCCRRGAQAHHSDLGRQLRAAVSGTFPFNGLFVALMEDANFATSTMKRIANYYGKELRISYNDVMRCLKEKEILLKEVLKVLEEQEDGSESQSDDKDRNDNSENDYWDHIINGLGSLLFGINNILAENPDENIIKGIKQDAIYTCASLGGGRAQHFKGYTIIKPEEHEEEIMEKAMCLKNQILCRAFGLCPSEQDMIPQTITIYYPTQRTINVSQSLLDGY